MNTNSAVIKSYGGLKALAKKQALSFASGKSSCVGLIGPLGVGKTAFVKEVARFWGCSEAVTSPTFTLMHHYTTKNGKTLLHIDLYRINSRDKETIAMILDAIIEADFTLIEWVDRVPQLKRQCDTVYDMRFGADGASRLIRIIGKEKK